MACARYWTPRTIYRAMNNAEKIAVELMRLQTEMRELERLTDTRMKKIRRRMETLQALVKEK